MERIHTTDEETLDLDRKYIGARSNGKPNGLWYSHDYSWHEWCEEADFRHPMKYDFLFDLDMSDVLVIDSLDKLKLLTIKPFDEAMEMGWVIWDTLFKKYKGFEVPNQNELRHKSMELGLFPSKLRRISMGLEIFIYGLDCDGGCIWDLSAVQSVLRRETTPLKFT